MNPHDAPSAQQLVEAVREWLERDVFPTASGRLQFHSRVAINMLRMVEREFELGPAQQRDHLDRLCALGVGDDAALSAAIRDGDLDDRLDEVRNAVWLTVCDKVAVANPKYLQPAPADGST